VEGGGDKTKIFAFKGASASELSQRCLGCHEYGEEHSNYGRSVHLQNGVACTDCHDPHHAKEGQFLLKASQPALCYGCHLDKKQQRMNLAEVDYRFSQKLGARVGFRYRYRIIADNFYETLNQVFYPGPTAALAARGACAPVNPANPVSQANLPAGCTLNSDSSISFLSVPAFVPASDVVPPINEFSGLFGIWARPSPKLQISFDTELFSADRSFTRISPRESQEYRVRAKYALTSWLNLNSNALIWEARNNVENVNNLQHNRTYGISAILQPKDKIGLEIGYAYNDVFSQILICFVSSAAPTGPSTVSCPGVTGLQQQLSTYTNNSQYGYFDLSLTPVHRLTAHLGANLTGTTGSALLVITPQVPSGPLDSKWLHPFGGLDYHFAKNWTGKAYWDYYGYHEDPTVSAATGAIISQDLLAPRNFRGNLVTLSVKYAF
jgi:predicted CXXCH cytochrome family protein